MHRLITLYTQHKPNLANLAVQYFRGFTIVHAEGWWEGVQEHAVKIEIACDVASANTVLHVHDLIRHIIVLNDQQSVLVRNSDGSVFFVERDKFTVSTIKNQLR